VDSLARAPARIADEQVTLPVCFGVLKRLKAVLATTPENGNLTNLFATKFCDT